MDYKTIVIDYNDETTEVVLGNGGDEYVGKATCSKREAFDEKIGIKVASARAYLPYYTSRIKELTEEIIDSKDGKNLQYYDLCEVDEMAKLIRRYIKHLKDETK
jgi:hypothetical protein